MSDRVVLAHKLTAADAFDHFARLGEDAELPREVVERAHNAIARGRAVRHALGCLPDFDDCAGDPCRSEQEPKA